MQDTQYESNSLAMIVFHSLITIKLYKKLQFCEVLNFCNQIYIYYFWERFS